MSGLKVQTVTGMEFEVYGAVTYKDSMEDGRIYYCAGASYPAELVKEIIYEQEAI